MARSASADGSAREPGGGRRRIAVNTAIFSVATGLSRIAGLVREIVASSFFGTSGGFSAFTLAFQVPNLVRSLFADAALSAAFVPVFTELLEKGERKEAFKLASTLFWLILLVLGAITVAFMLAADVVMPLFTGDEFSAELDALTAGLSKVLFPIVVLLGLNGLLVGILNAHDHFAIPAIAPLVWNVVIVVTLVAARPFFADGDQQLYAYAVGVLLGTAVQLAMCVPVLRRHGLVIGRWFDPRDPRVKRVLILMLPVTIGLGVINFNLVLNSVLGSLVSDEAPRAIDAAFRIYMLPQGMFSVAVATVLFPALARLAARGDTDGLRDQLSEGLRVIWLLLAPAAAFCLALSEPIVRLVYERGAFDASSTDQVAVALLWFSVALPFSGANLLLTRTFFSLQRPWAPTALAAVNLALTLVVSLVLLGPLGIAGLVIGTSVGTAGMTIGQLHLLRQRLDGRLDLTRVGLSVAVSTVAGAALGLVAYVVWTGMDATLGRSLVAQLLSVGLAGAAGALAFAAAVLWVGLPEAQTARGLIERRLPAGLRARRR